MTLESLIDSDAALGLSIDRLALHLLHDIHAHCQTEPNWQPHRYSFLNSAYAAYSNAALTRDQVTAVTQALAEAYDWLLLHGLLAVAPRDNQQGWLFITRKGEAILAAPNGVQLVQAEARIDLDLHPRIAARIRSQFLLGEYELAAFAAMREVEIRVRELAGTVADDDLNRGVKLMTRAFNANESGPLVDASSERGGDDEFVPRRNRCFQESAESSPGRLRRPNHRIRDCAVCRSVAKDARRASGGARQGMMEPR